MKGNDRNIEMCQMQNLRKKAIVISLLCLLHLTVYGQAIDNTWSFKNIKRDKYFRFSYENDYFASADRYYTQGINIELVAPWVKNFPLTKLLIHPKNSYLRYGLGIEDDAYTPTSTDKNEILFGDRPYASFFILKTFLIAIDPKRMQRFSATWSIGIIGPATGAMDLHTAIHRIVPNNSIPKGWSNQIGNDAILNYQVNYEKQLLSSEHFFSLDADGMIRIGSLSDKASAGLTMILGYFESPFSDKKATKGNVCIYGYEHPELDVTGYDATLEGGVFNKRSPYTLGPGDISHFTFQNRFGIVFVTHRLHLEYFRTFLSKEFNTGLTHKWGGLQIALAF